MLGYDGINRSSLRHQPVQARAADRITSLLDAAAAAVEEEGYETLTTQMVADRAGASIGTVYRYFPDRLSIIRGLAERNAQRLLTKLDGALEQEIDGWQSYLGALQSAVVSMFVNEPGYRRIRTGDHIDFKNEVGKFGVSGVLTERAWEQFHGRFGAEDNDSNREAVRLGVRILVSLTNMAFAMLPQGDQELLEAARRHAEQEIQPIFSFSHSVTRLA